MKNENVEVLDMLTSNNINFKVREKDKINENTGNSGNNQDNNMNKNYNNTINKDEENLNSRSRINSKSYRKNIDNGNNPDIEFSDLEKLENFKILVQNTNKRKSLNINFTNSLNRNSGLIIDNSDSEENSKNHLLISNNNLLKKIENKKDDVSRLNNKNKISENSQWNKNADDQAKYTKINCRNLNLTMNNGKINDEKCHSHFESNTKIKAILEKRNSFKNANSGATLNCNNNKINNCFYENSKILNKKINKETYTANVSQKLILLEKNNKKLFNNFSINHQNNNVLSNEDLNLNSNRGINVGNKLLHKIKSNQSVKLENIDSGNPKILSYITRKRHSLESFKHGEIPLEKIQIDMLKLQASTDFVKNNNFKNHVGNKKESKFFLILDIMIGNNQDEEMKNKENLFSIPNNQESKYEENLTVFDVRQMKRKKSKTNMDNNVKFEVTNNLPDKNELLISNIVKYEIINKDESTIEKKNDYLINNDSIFRSVNPFIDKSDTYESREKRVKDFTNKDNSQKDLLLINSHNMVINDSKKQSNSNIKNKTKQRREENKTPKNNDINRNLIGKSFETFSKNILLLKQNSDKITSNFFADNSKIKLHNIRKDFKKQNPKNNLNKEVQTRLYSINNLSSIQNNSKTPDNKINSIFPISQNKENFELIGNLNNTNNKIFIKKKDNSKRIIDVSMPSNLKINDSNFEHLSYLDINNDTITVINENKKFNSQESNDDSNQNIYLDESDKNDNKESIKSNTNKYINIKPDCDTKQNNIHKKTIISFHQNSEDNNIISNELLNCNNDINKKSLIRENSNISSLKLEIDEFGKKLNRKNISNNRENNNIGTVYDNKAFHDIHINLTSIINSKSKSNNNILNRVTNENKQQNNTITPEEPSICRICYEEQTNDKGELIRPCLCAGTMKYIHQSCLKSWIENNLANNKLVAHCEICQFNYQMKIDTKYIFSKQKCCNLMKTILTSSIICSFILALIFIVLYVMVSTLTTITSENKSYFVSILSGIGGLILFFIILSNFRNYRNTMYEQIVTDWKINSLTDEMIEKIKELKLIEEKEKENQESQLDNVNDENDNIHHNSYNQNQNENQNNNQNNPDIYYQNDDHQYNYNWHPQSMRNNDKNFIQNNTEMDLNRKNIGRNNDSHNFDLANNLGNLPNINNINEILQNFEFFKKDVIENKDPHEIYSQNYNDKKNKTLQHSADNGQNNALDNLQESNIENLENINP